MWVAEHRESRVGSVDRSDEHRAAELGRLRCRRVGVLGRERDAPMGGRVGVIAGDRRDRCHHVLETRGAQLRRSLARPRRELLEVVAVRAQRPELTAAEIERRPAEESAVETLCSRWIPGVEDVEVQRPRLVHDPRSLVLPRLQDAERCPLRVGEHRRPAGVHHLQRLAQHSAARLARFRRRLVGVLDPDVGVPDRLRRRSLRLRRHSRNIAAAEAGDQIRAGRPRRHRVLELPAEQAAVEVRSRVGVGLRRIDPARHTGDVTVALRQRQLLPLASNRRPA